MVTEAYRTSQRRTPWVHTMGAWEQGLMDRLTRPCPHFSPDVSLQPSYNGSVVHAHPFHGCPIMQPWVFVDATEVRIVSSVRTLAASTRAGRSTLIRKESR
jgi:hypothetical protein